MQAHEARGAAPLDALSKAATERLEKNLEGYGNRLSTAHKKALACIIDRLTSLAAGQSKGRWAYDLPCGGGKTQATVAWCAELWHQHRPYSVMVCQTQVEHLCELKRQLIKNGVPGEEIGLIHTLGKKATLPATEDNDQKQILLVSHQMVRNRHGNALSEINTYQDQPRSLVIWDESLLRSEHRSIEKMSFEQGLGLISPIVNNGQGSEDLGEAVSYLEESWNIIQKEHDRQKVTMFRKQEVKPLQLTLPEASREDLERYKEALPEREHLDTRGYDAIESVRQFISISQEPLRVLLSNLGNGGCITYDITIPKPLTNVMVLDASWIIRDLERLDKTIQDDPDFDGNVKDYRNVAFYFMQHPSGRAAMKKHFRQTNRKKRKLSLEIAAVVKDIPKDQGVLLVTFKKRSSADLDMIEKLKGDLAARGIDVGAKLPCGRPRFEWLTWGKHTSTSDFQHIQNLFLAGILHRSDVDLGGAIAGQQDDLTANITQTGITKVKRSEIGHDVLQVSNRISMRKFIDGLAVGAKVWGWHHDPLIRVLLQKAMPGLVWKAWETIFIRKNEGKIEVLAKAITGTLSTVEPFTDKIFTGKLKKRVGVNGVPSQTWKDALHQALKDLPEWELQARSVVRI